MLHGSALELYCNVINSWSVHKCLSSSVGETTPASLNNTVQGKAAFVGKHDRNWEYDTFNMDLGDASGDDEGDDDFDPDTDAGLGMLQFIFKQFQSDLLVSFFD